jgi:amino acid adenylation domain-containing protein
VLQAFNELVRRLPTAVALLDEAGSSVTYAELAARARLLVDGCLAEWALEQAPWVGAILPTHSASAVAPMLAVLAAGGTYVVLDPEQPKQRLELILSSTNAKVLLADAEHRELAGAIAGPARVHVYTEHRSEAAGEEASPKQVGDAGAVEGSSSVHALLPVKAVDDDRAAYIIFTSGSSGAPKGVVQPRSYLSELARRFGESIQTRPGDVFALVAPLTFSASVMDIYAALVHGAAVSFIDLRRLGLEGAARAIDREASILHTVPSVFRSVAPRLAQRKLARLRLLYLAGEPARGEDFELYRNCLPDHVRFANALGCTEFNLCRQFFADKSTRIEGAVVPVGHAASGAEVFLVDERGRRVAEGEVGEIVVESDYLSGRYFRDEALTAEKFSSHPSGGKRAYQTGDLGRWLPGGCLEHLGRRDAQVKVRGYRVELAEIENLLLRTAAVGECAVAPNGAGEGLEAFVVGEESDELRQSLLSVLRASLPAYCVPDRLSFVPSLPRTSSGKLDRAALSGAGPGFDGTAQGSEGGLEERVHRIWQRHLRRPELRMVDNLMDVGGNSLLALRIHVDLVNELSVKLTVVDLFKYPTIRALAAEIRTRRQGVAPASC